LAEQLNDLRAEMLETKEANLALREKIAVLKQELELKSKIVFDRGICWVIDDEMTTGEDRTPICPQCWQSDRVVNRQKIEQNRSSLTIRCQRCKTVHKLT
jgi:hypothetical protein